MSDCKFVFMPGDASDALLFASIRKRMESPLGILIALDAGQMWTTPTEAVQEVLSLLYAVDASMAKCLVEFSGNADVTTMAREWALSSPKAFAYLNRLLQIPSAIDLNEISNWYAFFEVRRQTMELNGIEVPLGVECPVSG